MTQRNPTLDVCKGIGMLLVIIGHLGICWGDPIYMFHMSLFFILSGVCFSDKYLDSKIEFIRKRFVSLMVPFIVFKGIAYAAINYGPYINTQSFIDEHHLLGTFWFLKCLFIASVIGLITIWGLRKCGNKKTWTPAIVVLILSFITSFTIGDENKAVFLYLTFHFLVGYAIKSHIPLLCDIATLKTKIVLIGGGLSSILMLPSVTPDIICDCTYKTYIPYCITAFTGCWLTLQVASYLVQRDLFAKTLIIIGQHTMPIMLFHFSAFMVVDLLIEYDIIMISADIFIILSKISLGVALPILLHTIYIHIFKDNIHKIRRYKL